MSNLHAHISTASADCDGSYSRTSVETLRDDEKANDFGFLDLDFKARVAGDLISMHSPGATLKVTEYGVEYHEDTEEGFVHTEVTWCEDECQAKSTRRDHRAEAAGY